MYYRQHRKNQIGANRGTVAAVRRVWMVFQKTWSRWNTINISALHAARDLLTEENQGLLESFAEARNKPVLQRIRALRRLGLYRQNPASSVGLWLAALLGRL